MEAATTTDATTTRPTELPLDPPHQINPVDSESVDLKAVKLELVNNGDKTPPLPKRTGTGFRLDTSNKDKPMEPIHHSLFSENETENLPPTLLLPGDDINSIKSHLIPLSNGLSETPANNPPTLYIPSVEEKLERAEDELKSYKKRGVRAVHLLHSGLQILERNVQEMLDVPEQNFGTKTYVDVTTQTSSKTTSASKVDIQLRLESKLNYLESRSKEEFRFLETRRQDMLLELKKLQENMARVLAEFEKKKRGISALDQAVPKLEQSDYEDGLLPLQCVLIKHDWKEKSDDEDELDVYDYESMVLSSCQRENADKVTFNQLAINTDNSPNSSSPEKTESNESVHKENISKDGKSNFVDSASGSKVHNCNINKPFATRSESKKHKVSIQKLTERALTPTGKKARLA